MKMFYEKDTNVNLIKDKKIAIFGYGSQGHAHALNLKDSGVKEVVVALRDGSSSIPKAESKGLKVMNLSDAAEWADVVMILTPDELDEKIKEMVEFNGPVIFDCRVDPNENCFPMIPSGKPHNQMILGPSEKEENKITGKGKALV